MTPTKEKTIEHGYKPVLLREEIKLSLQQLRRELTNRDLNQERRLISAAVELIISRPDLHEDWLRLIPDVVRRDLESQRQAEMQVRAA
jgi:hypothetical protein